MAKIKARKTTKKITKKAVARLIAYVGDNEVLVTAVENERAMVAEWFVQGNRDLHNYDRRNLGKVVQVSMQPIVYMY